jgi:hypothetical protein
MPISDLPQSDVEMRLRALDAEIELINDRREHDDEEADQEYWDALEEWSSLYERYQELMRG